MSESKTKPVDQLDLSPVHASIWANTDSAGHTFYTAQVTRRYKTDAGFRSTSSYGQRDADKFIQAAQWVKERLTVLNQKEGV